MSVEKTVMSKRDAIKLSRELSNELPVVELHVLHTVVGALLNRDFNNRQKVLNFGGTLRGRFSSASVLHDIRYEMEDAQNIHTKYLPELIKNSLTERCSDEGVRDIEYKVLAELFKTESGKNNKGKKTSDDAESSFNIAKLLQTEQILDIDQYTLSKYVDEIEAAAQLISNNNLKLGEAVVLVKKNMALSSADRPLSDVTALFGRMAADQMFSTVYSPIRVSHAFTIDAYKNDYDDYTAIDDYLQKVGVVLTDDDGIGKNSGAAYMDTSDVSGNTYYRYCSISQAGLFQNLCIGKPFDMVDELKEQTYKLTAHFAKSFIGALPSGMQTRKFTRTPPTAVYIDKAPNILGLSAADMYESAVHASENKSVCDIGVERLQQFMDKSVNGCFVERELTGQYWMSDKYFAPDGIPTISYKDLEAIVRP